MACPSTGAFSIPASAASVFRGCRTAAAGAPSPQQGQAHPQFPYVPPQVQVGGVPSQVPSSNVPGGQLGTASVHGAASRICLSLMSALWSTADDGRMALGYFGSSSVTAMVTMIVTLCALLPVAQFAPGYVFWMRTPAATISVFAVTFQSVYPALHARLVSVGSQAGIECQQEIRALTVELQRTCVDKILAIRFWGGVGGANIKNLATSLAPQTRRTVEC